MTHTNSRLLKIAWQDTFEIPGSYPYPEVFAKWLSITTAGNEVLDGKAV